MTHIIGFLLRARTRTDIFLGGEDIHPFGIFRLELTRLRPTLRRVCDYFSAYYHSIGGSYITPRPLYQMAYISRSRGAEMESVFAESYRVIQRPQPSGNAPTPTELRHTESRSRCSRRVGLPCWTGVPAGFDSPLEVCMLERLFPVTKRVKPTTGNCLRVTQNRYFLTSVCQS